MNNDTHAIFIHGVGYFDKGDITSHPRIVPETISDTNIDDFCWSETVSSPKEGDSISLGYLMELGKALQKSAWLGFGVNRDKQSLFKKVALLISNFCASILYFLTLIAPLILFFYYGSWVVSKFTIEADPVWGYSIVDPPWPYLLVKSIFGPDYLNPLYSNLIEIICNAALIFALISTIFSQFCFGFIDGLKSSARRILLILIWPLVFVCVAFGTYTKRTVISILIFIIAPVFGIMSKVVVFMNDDFTSAYQLLFFPVAILVVALVLKIIGSLFGTQLKYLGDIFFYLGNRKYRDELLNAFNQFVESKSISSNHKVLIVSHSLGTVIATDFLLTNKSLVKNDIQLITMGSPLKRLIYNFFPTIIPFPTVIAKALYNLYDNINWLNIYRPLDFIGGKLCRNNHELINNVSTKQYKDPFSSHIGYWNDNKVKNIIKMNKAQKIHLKEIKNLTEPISFHIKNEWKLNKINKLAFILLLFGHSLWKEIIIENYFEPNNDKKKIALRYADLRANGKKAIAILQPSKTIDKDRGADGIVDYFPNYRITLFFRTEEGKEEEINFIYKIWIDMKKLTKQFKNGKTISDSFYREVVRYSSFQTPIIYHPDNPNKFMLVDYTTDQPTSDGLYPVMEYLHPISSPIIDFVMVLILFGALISSYVGTSSILVEIAEWVIDFLEDLTIN